MIKFNDVHKLPIQGLPMRGIKQDIAAKYGVRCEVDTETGQPSAYYYPLYRDGQLAGYQRKVARKPGDRQKGDISRVYQDPVRKTQGCLPFGADTAGNGGKMVVVVEGAEDALAGCQMLQAKGKSYRIVSTLGTDGWKRTLEYFEGFDKVIIAYDMDTAGRQAASAFCAALTPGKGAVASWPERWNDPNSILANPKGPDVWMDSLWNARAPENGAIIYGELAWQAIESYTEPEYVPYPPEFELLNEKLRGMRRGEISLWTSGTGCGKSAFIRRIKQHIIQSTGWRVGDVELEETKEKTIRAMLQYQARKSMREMTPSEKRAAHEATYGTNRLFTVDRRSRLGKGTTLLSQLKHLRHGYGCDIIFLDHITLAQDELGEGREGNSAQDRMMSDLLELVESTGVHICLISHLRKTGTGGKSFEEGAMPGLDDLKGCLSGDTEVLTPTGWIRIDCWSGSPILVVHPTTQVAHYEQAEYLKLPNTHGFYHIKSTRGLDQLVSEEHRLLVNHNPALYQNHFITSTEYVARHDLSKHGSTLRIPTTYTLDMPGLPLTDDELRLEIACQADGHQRKDCKPGHIQFMFHKERKYLRLLDLCKRAGVRFTDHGKVPSGAYVVRAWLRWGMKEFHPKLYQISVEQARIVHDEVFHWDGTFTPTAGEYFTKHRDWADWMQHVFSLCGVRSIVRMGTNVLEVCTSRNNTVSLANKDSKTPIELVPSNDGHKYCFTTSTGAFVARRNGRVFLTGNSGSVKQISMDIIALGRNLQHPDPYQQNVTRMRILKNREDGNVGDADALFYDKDTYTFEKAVDDRPDDTPEEAAGREF